jgi:TatD DNase family protein
MTPDQTLSLIDTHCHLDATAFAGQQATVLEQARLAGITQVVVPATQGRSFSQTLSMQQLHHCPVAFGLHPIHIHQHQDQHLDLLEHYLTEHHPVALGEIGLDAWMADPDLARQESLLIAQLKLARKYDLPVILHCRRTQDRLLKFLRRYPVNGGIVHAFNGSLQQAQIFIQLGFRLGFGGAMTFDGSQRIRHLASTLPLDALVLETDAPDMRPSWEQQQINHPANLAHYARLLAALRGSSIEEIAEATSINARKVLRLG